jgi:hypothetical protein
VNRRSPAISGVQLIAAERRRQVEVLGHDLSHDQGHFPDELAHAGAWYALSPRRRSELEHVLPKQPLVGDIWPRDWVFRGNTARIRELVKAGALIAAEIDRLRAEGGKQ